MLEAVRWQKIFFAVTLLMIIAAGLGVSDSRDAEAETVQTTLRAQHSGKCLTVHPGDQRNGAVAYQWTCGSSNNLAIVDAGAGWFYIIFVHSGKCLTVHQYASWDGATLNQWDCQGQPNQKWGGSFNNGVISIHGSQAYPNKCLTVDGESRADGAVVNQWQCSSQANQSWLPVLVGDSSCHSSYVGACLNPNASDYDCAGGSGDGPFYTGQVTIVGPDVFQLDRDKDGFGCEVGDSGGVAPGSSSNCDPSYPTVCIPPPPPDLDCGQIPYRNFPVVGSDPHGFDGNDNDGIGCET